MASFLVPVAYLVVVLGSLLIFSFFYRRRQSVVEPYFGPHVERNTYITLLQKTDPPPHEGLLKAALVRRAVEDVYRVLRIREDKPALQNLLQKGTIGDDLYNSLLAAEKELEAEIVEVVGEANSFVEGWGQVIFPTANEVIVNEKMRQLYEKIPEIKGELEKRHDVKAKNQVPVGPAISLVPSGPAPNVPPPLNSVPSVSSPVPVTPSTAQTMTPTSSVPPSATSTNGDWNSVDGDSDDSEQSAPLSPAKSPKSKKGKKRK